MGFVQYVNYMSMKLLSVCVGNDRREEITFSIQFREMGEKEQLGLHKSPWTEILGLHQP